MTTPHGNPPIDTLISECSNELRASLDALLQKHGERKMLVALTLHNSGVMINMLRKSGAGEPELRVLARHLGDAVNLLCVAYDFDADEVSRIAEGVDEQCALLTADVMEAKKADQKEIG